MDNNLGRFKQVDLRQIWVHEAISFTNWLAREENLELLSEEIGISIKLLKTEAEVGGFNLDILAEEEGTNRKIIIENQLEITNHDHLGKILTYASGVKASIVIWIFKNIRDEHRQAIDWLNEHTDDDIDFFALKMELWQIGDSLPAPKFQIICKPNSWAKIAKTNTEQSELTPTKIYQWDMWNAFKEYALEHKLSFNLHKTRPQHWYDFSVGSSQCHISLTVNTRIKEFGCELYIQDNKDLFDFLFSQKDLIEKELGFKPDWLRLPDETKASSIKIRKKSEIIGIKDFSKYEDAYKWMMNSLEIYKKVFRKYLSEYK